MKPATAVAQPVVMAVPVGGVATAVQAPQQAYTVVQPALVQVVQLSSPLTRCFVGGGWFRTSLVDSRLASEWVTTRMYRVSVLVNQ